MARFLVTFNDNYSDELDVHGFKIMTEKEVSNFEELALSINWEFSYQLIDGSLRYLNGDDLLSRFEFKEISKSEYDTLSKLFEGKFGTFIDEEFLESIADGESDEPIGYSDYDEFDSEDEYDDDDY